MALQRSSTEPSEAQSPTSTNSGFPLIPPHCKRSASRDLDIEKHAGHGRVDSMDQPRVQPPSLYSAKSGQSQSTHSLRSVHFETECRALEACQQGYPHLAAFLSSDHNFALYRKFSYLRSRLLLVHQLELSDLEEELDELDEQQSKNGEQLRVQSWGADKQDAAERDERRSRVDIFNDIKEKLVAYDDLLMRTKEVESMQTPSNRDYRSVRRFFSNEAPLPEPEMAYVKCKEDLATLRSGRECAGFDGFIEAMLYNFDGPLVRYLFMTEELRRKTKNQSIHYYSPERIDTFVGLIITAVIFILLIIPVVVMYEMTSFGNQHSTFRAISVLIVFTLVFGAAMSLLTRARRHELFAASAAYCAVLVVFISNFSGNLA